MFESDQNKDVLYADVILPFPLQNSFSYAVPEELVPMAEIGKRAIVQFGPKKMYTALIIRLHHQKPENYQIKEVLDIIDPTPVLFQTQINFWQWMADYYCCSIGEVMSVALPSSMKLESESQISLNPSFDGDITELDDQEQIITGALIKNNDLPIKKIQELLHKKNVFPLIKSLYLKNVILPQEEMKESYKPRFEKRIKLHPSINSIKKIQEVFNSLERAPKQLDLFMAFQVLERKSKVISQKELLKKSGVSSAILKALVDKNIFVSTQEAIDRIEIEETEAKSFDLSEAQKEAWKNVKESFKKYNTSLLHGITSSGKTHIYVKLIEETLAKGRQVLYLLPEIALTAQLIQRLRSYFGDKIGIYHSKFNPNERYEIWHKTLNREYEIVLGVRSAIFLPFRDLGLIIVDEEHENTFKQQSPAPRFQARDSAVYLSHLCGAKCLLGSATPSFETFYNVGLDKYGYIELNQRYKDVKPPQMVVGDLRIDYKRHSMKANFGQLLFNEIQKTKENDKQSILFQNRRGFAPYIECQTCGWVPHCKNCDISLTYHQFSKNLRCHYCGYQARLSPSCKNCGNPNLKLKGYGTERIEEDVAELFPNLKLIRMDQDTTRSKSAYKKMITRFEKGEADILLGTQMVSKGLDFEKVMLVGVMNADQMLNYPDFRASERAWQLMSQVGGRAGRRAEQGKVIIQTLNPHHPLFTFLLNQDFKGFYKSEMLIRKEFLYPPYRKLILIDLRTKDVDLLKKGAALLGSQLKQEFGTRVLGPEFPLVSRLKSQYINQIMIKFERNSTYLEKSKLKIVDIINKWKFNSPFKRISTLIDVDPY